MEKENSSNKLLWVLVFLMVIFVTVFIILRDEEEVEGVYDEPSVNVEASAEVDAFADIEYSGVYFNNRFEHTKPGEYSDIYVDVSGFEPGEYTIVYLRKPGTEEYIGGGQPVNADENGRVQTSFRIYNYGEYEVYLNQGGETYTNTIVVE